MLGMCQVTGKPTANYISEEFGQPSHVDVFRSAATRERPMRPRSPRPSTEASPMDDVLFILSLRASTPSVNLLKPI